MRFRITLETVTLGVAVGMALLVAPLLGAEIVRASEGPASESERPKYQTLRHEEDWSGFRGSDRSGDLDSLKYIEVADGGAVWLSLGGQLRERLEIWDDFAFGAPAVADDVFLLTRLFAHADLHIGEAWRVFLQAKSSLSSDRDLPGGRRTLELDRLDIQNGFVEFNLPFERVDLRIRAGREELLFGKQRLVSPLDWSNTRRTFDGATVELSSGATTATAFFTKPVVIDRAEINDSGNDEFFGIYANHVCGSGSGVDFYLFGLDRDGVTFNQLFPLGHAYLGFIDIIGRQNIMDARAGVKIPVVAKTTLGLDFHNFRRVEAADALYNAGGGVVRTGSPGSSKDVGSEIDVTFKHKLARHILVVLGFNHFFPGDFVDDTGASKAIDFGYVIFQYTM